MIEPWSHSYKITQPGLEPRSIRLKILCFQLLYYTILPFLGDGRFLSSNLLAEISKANGQNCDKPTGIWHFYQEKNFHFLC